MAENLFTLQLKEEWRMLTSYFSSDKLFFAFPLVLLLLGFFMASLIPFIERAFDMKELLTAFHLLLGLYGIFVGGFGFFADEVAQRWFRDAKLLIHMYDVLPISFRRILTWFYIKDIVYYLFLTIFPLFLGAFLSFAIPFPIFAKVVVSSVLMFLIGVSITFLVSALYVRNRLSLVGVALIAGLMYVRGFSFSDFPPLQYLYGDLTSAGVSIVIFVTFSVISLIITTPVTKPVKKLFPQSHLFYRIDPLLAKEIIDVRRSGTYQVIATSYLFPLFFLYGIFYFSGRLFQVPLDIPLTFYAVFIGYLSTLVYSWLHNIDPPSPMRTLPVTMSQIIKKKIKLFLAASFVLAVVYLIILSYLLSDLSILPLSVYSMGSITFYVAGVTAYLCGLYPNTRLFDGSVLIKYLGAILPVLVLLSILSLTKSSLEIFVVSSVVVLLSFLVYKRLDRKYEGVYLD